MVSPAIETYLESPIVMTFPVPKADGAVPLQMSVPFASVCRAPQLVRDLKATCPSAEREPEEESDVVARMVVPEMFVPKMFAPDTVAKFTSAPVMVVLREKVVPLSDRPCPAP